MNVVWCIAYSVCWVMNKERCHVKERCNKWEFEHETNTMKWIVCCVGFGLVFIVGVHMCCGLKLCWMSDSERIVAQRKRVRKGKSWKKGKGEKWFEGKERLWAFVWLCFFSLQLSLLSVCHATTLLLTHTHTTLYTAPSHTQHATQACLCAALFLSLCVTVSALIPHSINQHNTMQPCNHHTWHNQWMMQWVNGKE